MSEPAQIHALDTHVINQIAAGEVVERPASVVKELVENSLDAGARNIKVCLQDGGLARICVADDGCGMQPQDADQCVMRHATSKLRTAADLSTLRTLGFRGEALSSIAAVCKLRLVTRRATDHAGYRLVLNAGTVVQRSAVGAPPGTCVEVDDLFYNQPARQKFMRAAPTEQAHAVELCCRIILGARRGGVVVTHGARRLLDIRNDAPVEQRLHAALGPQVEAWQQGLAKDAGVCVTAYVGQVRVDRSESKSLWLFVNGRFVRDRMRARAIHSLFYDPARGTPRRVVAVVYVDLPPDQVDVNVHPQKTEVRFAVPQLAYRVVVQALAKIAPAACGGTASYPRGPQAAYRSVAAEPVELAPDASLPAPAALTCLSVLHDRYVLGRWQQVLLLFDWPAFVHADTASALQHRPVRLHRLILPACFAVTPPQDLALQQRGAQLADLGFGMAPVGPNMWALRLVPEALAAASPGDIAAVVQRSLMQAPPWESQLQREAAQQVPAVPQMASVQTCLDRMEPAALVAQPPTGLVVLDYDALHHLAGPTPRPPCSRLTGA